MTQTDSNTKQRTFTHLTDIERVQLAAYLDKGLSLREIGRMGRNASTSSREVSRGIVEQIDTNRKPYTKYFPDAAVGYAKRQEQFEYVPSTKTLYNWIVEEKLSVINLDLAMKLRRSTKAPKPHKHKKYWERALRNALNQ